MALLLRNLQRAVPVRRAPLRRRLQLLRAALGVQRFDLAVVCVDNRTIRRINGVYRARDAPTDVLSFPFHEVTATHGLCHLLGFTHSTEAEWQKMFQKEKEVLEELSRLTGTRLQPLSRGLF
ncbi:putative ribonuclease isoform X2 [Enhydra lutris kenyoni]|uniref:Ribonuclease isoform X2 n=1 Tax=Enhydra lutris kenyoni TaxID=391180 RepID=A0A2Y9KFM3_ENHLU|nr:putative ribonuclease isoform X2 [Enhydra lutris kenyoni]